MIKLSIVIPCYNESGNIPLIIDRLSGVLNERTDVEVILVDNGSTDDSAKILHLELARHKNSVFRCVTVAENRGYGFGILSGLREAQGEVLAWTHADMQTDPNDVLRALEVFDKHPGEEIFVKGKRKKRKSLESCFTLGMQLVAWSTLGTYLDDINAQPKLFSRKFYETNIEPDAPKDFSLDLYALYQAKNHGCTICEVPVFFNKRVHGEAKGGGSWKTRIKLIRRTLAYTFELSRKIQKL